MEFEEGVGEEIFSDTMKAKFLEQEVTRLQELCRTNFSAIDDLRKENRKLLDVQIELKETTSDLAYSLAECPWWKEDNMSIAIRILASYTQKVQYILGLPTFIDPEEQLEKNGRFNHRTIKRILNRTRTNGSSTSKLKYKCPKCKKSFMLKRNFNNHKNLHKQALRTLHCKCGETFPAFLLVRHQVQDCKHSNSVNKFLTAIQKSHRNLRIKRYAKCEHCRATFVSARMYYKHLRFCKFSQADWNHRKLFDARKEAQKNNEQEGKRRRITFSFTEDKLSQPDYQNGNNFDEEIQCTNTTQAGNLEDGSLHDNVTVKIANSDNNESGLLNFSIADLIRRGIKITVHNRPRSYSCKSCKNSKEAPSPCNTETNDVVWSNGQYITRLSSNKPPLSDHSFRMKCSEYNSAQGEVDQLSKTDKIVYHCKLCEFHTNLKHLLNVHNNSQCRWRHFLADQIPFLKTLTEMNFKEPNSNDLSNVESQCEHEVSNPHKRCRARAATL